MKIAEYQAAARMTAVYPMEAAITYPALGLIGEWAEYCEKRETYDDDDDSMVAELGKELGDILWYCANLAWDLNSTVTDALGGASPDLCFDEVTPQYYFSSEVLLVCGRAAEAAKKQVRDGSKPELKQRLLVVIREAMEFVAQECDDLGLDRSGVAEANIEKLKSRQERGVLKGDGDNR